MILQLILKRDKEFSEVIRDKVKEAQKHPNGDIDVYFEGDCYVRYQKDDEEISQMWLLNDNFKTLKRLI